MHHRHEIDGLRAVAVLPVILFHAGIGTFSGGFVGVDVFFVISGYLITGIIIGELDRGTFSIARFYERRARRILPALFLVILVCLPFAWAWMAPGQLEDFGAGIIAVTLFASNILFWFRSGYFEPSAADAPLLHTWSLAVEEQFYLFFPLLLLLVWRFGRKRIFWIIAGIAAVSLLLSEWGWRHAPEANFYLTPTRAWELLAGSLCAFVSTDRGPGRQQLLAALGLGLIVFATLTFDSSTPFPSLYALAPVGGTALIILFGSTGTWTAALLSSRPLVGIGLISYSAYLWHQPLFAFARIVTLQGRPPQALMLGLTALSLVLAYGSWRFVEQPFRRRGGGLLPSPRAVLCASALAMSVFFVAGVAMDQTKGFVEVRSGERQRSLYDTATWSPYRNRCHTEGADFLRPDAACAYFSDNVEFAVLGDSHAVELAYALARLLESDGIGVRQLTFSACEPSFGGASIVPHCAQWTEVAIDSILADDRIKNVVVSYRIHAHLFGDQRDAYPEFPDRRSDAERRSTWSAFIRTLETLVASDKNVVLVLQAPELPTKIENLIYRASGDEALPGVARDWWAQRSAYVEERLSDIPAGVITIDPADSFCDATSCFAARGGTSYYFDDNHMSVAGAGIVANQILDRLERPKPVVDPTSTVMRTDGAAPALPAGTPLAPGTAPTRVLQSRASRSVSSAKKPSGST